MTVLRMDLEFAQKIIYACCVLENIARKLGEGEPEEGAPVAGADNNVEFHVQYGVVQYGDPDVEVINAAGRTAMRTRAVVARSAMMSAMPN